VQIVRSVTPAATAPTHLPPIAYANDRIRTFSNQACYRPTMPRFRRLIDPAVLTLILSLVVGSLWLGTHDHDSDFGAGFVLGLIAGGSLAFMALGSRRERS
jgi:hypothetical protein